ncbi:late competence development ComFB family protein [Oscillospiraceae bacterium 38-13]
MASNNSSKTAHVMNLLSKNRGAAPEPQEPAAAPEAPPAAVPQEEAAPPAAPHVAPVAPIISSINADAAVSSQIKDALEAELESAASPKPPAPPAPKAEAPAAPAPKAPPAPAPAEAPASAPEAAPSEAVMDLPVPGGEEEKPAYINVMQILVEEKADEYMNMFGICSCDKCRVDVRAFALNHLPPKYVVLSENERVPRLTVYESRFSSDITAQLIQACKQVMLTPHHTRADN